MYLEVIDMSLMEFVWGCGITIVALLGMVRVAETLWFHNRNDEEPFESESFSDATSMCLREAFWVCDDCGQEFRLLDGSLPPLKCPGCGAVKADDSVVADDESEAEIFVCPVCSKRVEMLDGAEPECCPCCGRETDKEWATVP